MEYRYPPSPSEGKTLDTEGLRKNFLIEQVFKSNEITMVYSHSDRMIAASAMPVDFFLQRRELGIINIIGDGKILIDGNSYNMSSKDGLYIGAGNKKVEFKSSSNLAKFYLNSSPANTQYPTVHIQLSNANHVELVEIITSNKITIYIFTLKFVNHANYLWELQFQLKDVFGILCIVILMKKEWKFIYILIWMKIQEFYT